MILGPFDIGVLYTALHIWLKHIDPSRTKTKTFIGCKVVKKIGGIEKLIGFDPIRSEPVDLVW